MKLSLVSSPQHGSGCFGSVLLFVHGDHAVGRRLAGWAARAVDGSELRRRVRGLLERAHHHGGGLSSVRADRPAALEFIGELTIGGREALWSRAIGSRPSCLCIDAEGCAHGLPSLSLQPLRDKARNGCATLLKALREELQTALEAGHSGTQRLVRWGCRFCGDRGGRATLSLAPAGWVG